MHAAAYHRTPLTIEQTALLWCMRLWVVDTRAPVGVLPRILRIATELDAPGAVPFIDGLMFALKHGATRSLAVACVCCPSTTGDERTVLDGLGLAQERRTFEALLALRGLLTPEGARAALVSAEGIGTELARVGRFLPAPDAAMGQFAHATWPTADVP